LPRAFPPAIVIAVSVGRGSRALFKILALVFLVAVAVAGATSDARAAKQKKPAVSFSKARVQSDGLLLPGQQETVFISGLPPRADFKVGIEPPPTTPQCGEFYFCNIVRVFPAAGAPAFRSTGKGTAFARFVTPGGYTLQSDPFDKRTRRMVAWMNGQAVHINTFSVRTTKKERLISFGFGRAVMQVP
jgi:hypothetical protein